MGSLFSHIQSKLIVAFVVVVIIPLLVVGVYSYKTTNSALTNTALDAELSKARAQADAVSTFLQGVQDDVLFLSKSAPMKKMLQARRNSEAIALGIARTELEQEFKAFSQQKAIYYQVRYLDETGQEVVRVDSDGKNVRSIPEGNLQNKAGRYYFDDTMKLNIGGLMVSPLDLNMERGKIETPHKPVIRYATPVFYPNGTRAGVVITNIFAERFLALVKADSIDGINYLVDDKGYYLTHPNEAKRWGRDLKTNVSLANDLPADKAKQLIAGGEGTLSQGDDFIGYATVVPAGQTAFHWTVVTTRPQSKVLAPVNTFRNMFLGLAAIALLIALLLGRLLGGAITRPIIYLTEMADNVSRGDLDGAIEIKTGDEIESLAKSVERMRVSIRISLARLQKRMAKRR